MKTTIQLKHGLRADVPRGFVTTLARRLQRAAPRVGLSRWTPGEVNVRIVDDEEMRALHAEHMGDDKTTDVLAFPVPDAPQLAGGDIAINWHAVVRQAGPGAAERLNEATILGVHGLAHLAGHDHVRPHEGRRMHAAERRGLAAVAVPDIARPYGIGRR